MAASPNFRLVNSSDLFDVLVVRIAVEKVDGSLIKHNHDYARHCAHQGALPDDGARYEAQYYFKFST